MELLAPAGNLEKLKFAVDYGADAVYFGGTAGSLRAGAGNMDANEIHAGTEYAHRRGRRAYMALNTFAHDEDFAPIDALLRDVKDAGIDAFIVADPGILSLVRERLPDAALHLSTQANLTNARAARFWRDAGVSRIILARELTLAEISALRAAVPQDMELECFVHGAMCLSYSGRCLLSNAMTGRDANRGACAHPCRYEYSLMEAKRPGEYLPVMQEGRSAFILNSKDLCMIEHIPALAAAGIHALKIEGRMKSAYYTAVTTAAYRAALDAWREEADAWVFRDVWRQELEKASHRPLATGFYFGWPGADGQDAGGGGYIKTYDFVGVVKSYDAASGCALVEQRNKFAAGDRIEFFGPDRVIFAQTIEQMQDEEGNAIDSAPHAQQRILIKTAVPVGENYILRRQKTENTV